MKGERNGKWETEFLNETLPNRILYSWNKYSKIMLFVQNFVKNNYVNDGKPLVHTAPTAAPAEASMQPTGSQAL